MLGSGERTHQTQQGALSSQVLEIGAPWCKANSKLHKKEGNFIENYPFQLHFSQAELICETTVSGVTCHTGNKTEVTEAYWDGASWEEPKQGKWGCQGFKTAEKAHPEMDSTPPRDRRREEMSLRRCREQRLFFAPYLPRWLAWFKLCYLSCYEIQSNKYFIYSSIFVMWKL